MKKSSKSLLMCMLITGICAGSAQGVFAEEKIGEFNLIKWLLLPVDWKKAILKQMLT